MAVITSLEKLTESSLLEITLFYISQIKKNEVAESEISVVSHSSPVFPDNKRLALEHSFDIEIILKCMKITRGNPVG